MELRMLRAVTLLRDTRAKVINVAEQCGFNHLGLFNTCFKRRFGTSPGRWRALYAESINAPPDAGANTAQCPFLASGLCPTLGLFNSGKAPESQSLRLRNAAVSAALGKSGATAVSAGRLDIPPPGVAASPVSSGWAALKACA
jgi:hypothetical protein